MNEVTIRQTTVELPIFPEESGLVRVDSLAAALSSCSRFELAGARVRSWDVKDMHLVDGKVRGVRAETGRVSGLTSRSVEFTDCEFGGMRWTGGKLSRTRFDGCKLLAASLESATLDHVIFHECKMDYAVLKRVRVQGPVMFVRCSFQEAEFQGCDLRDVLFDGCNLGLTVFGPGHYRGCDLRGNDISTISGAHHLSRVIIDRAQLLQLAEALAVDLQVSFGDL